MTDARGAEGPSCPFCGEPWTEAMLGQYDAMLDPGGCACCGPVGAATRHGGHGERVLPASDLCCWSCGKPIYRAPASLDGPSS